MQSLIRRLNDNLCIGRRWVHQWRRMTTHATDIGGEQKQVVEEDYRTQRKPTYTLPYYGASDEEIEALGDEKAKQILKVYGGLVRKKDTGNDWRTRLRKATRSWYLPKQLTISGVVVSDKMVKSVVIAAERPRFNKKYEVGYTKTRRFMAHDELNLCREGDDVTIRSCRPLSKRKAHVVVRNYGDKLRSGTDDRKIVLEAIDADQNVATVEGAADNQTASS